MKQQGAKKEVNPDLSLHPQVVLCQVVDPPDQDQAAHLPVLQVHQVQTHLMINTKTKIETRTNMTTIKIRINIMTTTKTSITIMTTRIDIMIMINTGTILTFDGSIVCIMHNF